MDAKPEIQSPTPDRQKRIVKRYSNRKLYDTKDSRYVTLLQIAEMVRGGEEVQSIDYNSKEALTEVTLAQIGRGKVEQVDDKTRAEFRKNWAMMLDGLKKAAEAA
mgnify:CR=1 FL=1